MSDVDPVEQMLKVAAKAQAKADKAAIREALKQMEEDRARRRDDLTSFANIRTAIAAMSGALARYDATIGQIESLLRQFETTPDAPAVLKVLTRSLVLDAVALDAALDFYRTTSQTEGEAIQRRWGGE